MIFADTNILLRSLYPADPLYAVADNALATLRFQKETLCIAPQSLVEFWSVATRPRSENGLGMDTPKAAREIAALRNLFLLLSYPIEVVENWQRIVAAQGISGKQTHDAHIVAIMQVHSIASILTFNERHFKRYTGITVLNPALI